MPIAANLLPAASKVCSSCGLVVARRDCHKNRYDQYICRACQASGVRFTRFTQLRFLGGRLFSWFWLGLAVVVLLSLLIFTLYVLVAHVDVFSLLRTVAN